MGLLDIDMSRPEAQGFNNGLLGMAQALLTPQARGGGMGAAFAAFPAAIDRAKQNAMREQLMALQGKQIGLQTDKLGFDMEQARAQAAQKEALKAQVEQWISTLPPEQQGIARMMPQKFAETMLPQAPKLETIFTPQGQEQKAWVRGPGFEPQPVGGAKQAPMPWEYEPDGQGGFRMKPGVLSAKTQVAQAGAGKGLTFVQEKEYDKTRGKALAEQFGEIQSGARKGFSELAQLQRMEQLLGQVKTGLGQSAMNTLKAVADTLGFKIEGLGPAQAFEALSNQMALAARSTGDGAGMPGAMSDQDRNFLKQIVPGMEKTTEGNRLIIEVMKRMAQRKIEVARFAQEYESKHGRLDSGFELALSEYVNSRPLFGDMEMPVPTDGADGAPMSPQDYLKRHGGK